MGRIVNFVGLCRAPAVLVVVLLVGATGAQATIINVPDDFGTIQAAIDAAAVGDTVLVQAGSYDEALVVDRSLTLLGANAGIHPAVGTHPSEVVGSRGPESILNHAAEALQPTAADVSVDGFQFTGGGGRIVTTSSDADNFQLRNCIFANDTAAAAEGVLHFSAGSHLAMVIEFNLFQDQGDHSLYCGGGPWDGLTVAWNGFNVAGDALTFAGGALSGAVIEGNELDGTIDSVPGVGACTFAIPQGGDLQILDNWCHDLLGTPFAVGIVGGSVSGNVIEMIHAEVGEAADCFRLRGGTDGSSVSQDVAFDGNVFHFSDVVAASDPTHGVLLESDDDGPGIDGGSIVMRDNQFIDGGEVNGALAVRHQGNPDLPADARYNDWGDASGPYHATVNPYGQGAPVGDFVEFVPWLGMPTTGALLPASSGPLVCGEEAVLSLHYVPAAGMPPLRGFEITFQLEPGDDSVVTVTDAAPAGDFALFAPDIFFYLADFGGGLYVATGAILGGDFGLVNETDLFTITCEATGSGAADITILTADYRDLSNIPIPGLMDGAQIAVDCTAPGPVTSLTAATGHQKMILAWIDPEVSGELDDFADIQIFRGLWYDADIGEQSSAYPEYDDRPGATVPTPPADYSAALASAEWIPVGSALPGDQAFTDLFDDPERGVYYYAVFAVDELANGSSGAATGGNTNYWLGDVANMEPPYDGQVSIADISYLGAVFTLECDDPGYAPEVDYGPTHNGSRLGIPLTDCLIDFEDLMIAAMNYGVVTPAPAGAAGAMVGAMADATAGAMVDATTRDVVRLQWRREDSATYTLRLVASSPQLQGLRLRASLTETASVSAGDALAEQNAPHFLHSATDRGLDISLALLGNGAGFAVAGELLRVTTAAAIEAGDLQIVLRSTGNEDLEFSFDESTGVGLPRVFALGKNFPNPFNPRTTIDFSLPSESPVQLRIYGIDGRLVRTLVDEMKPAGAHTAIWNGRDDRGSPVASGTYFYRIVAGSHEQVRKMTLMK